MRNFFFLILVVCGINSAHSQEVPILDISHNINVNYTFANIYWDEITKKELSSTLVVILKQADPQNTPTEYFEGTDEVLSNLLISLANTGEYAKSKLYKIPRLNNPQIIEIKENLKTEKIIITIKYKDKRGTTYTKDFYFERIY